MEFSGSNKSNFVFPLESDDVKDSELADAVDLTDNVKFEINYIDDCDSAVNDVDDFIDDDCDGKIYSEDEDCAKRRATANIKKKRMVNAFRT